MFIREIQKENLNTVFVIEEDREVIGSIEMFYDMKTKLLRILALDVKEEKRREGIGRRLVKASKGFARYNKADSILVIVEKSNSPALGFFMKEGFKQPDAEKDYNTPPETEVLLFGF